MLFFVLLIAAFLLVGCAPKITEQTNDAINYSAKQPKKNEPVIENSSDINPPTTDNPRITVQEAETIALNHAGFTSEEVTRLHTEFDINDHIPHYDIEFHRDLWEYEYEINADTGAIISCEKDQ